MTLEAAIIQALRSDDIELQLQALEEYLRVNRRSMSSDARITISREAILALKRSSNRLSLAERMANLGDEIVPGLLQQLQEANHPSEVRTLCALLLVEHRNLSGLSILIEEIATKGEYRCAAASALASKGIDTHIPAILSLLRNLPLGSKNEIPDEEQDELLTFLRLVRQFREILPSELHERFTSENSPKSIRDFVAINFRPSA